jgi:hypothetical protein
VELFNLGRLLHSSIGTIALGSFWVAALAAKGGALHRKAGKIYLLALVGVMTTSTLMVAGRVREGDVGSAIFLGFLISLVGSASWLTWFSIRYRRESERLLGLTYRSLASWLTVSGLALFALGVARRAPLMMLLSMLGVGFGMNMWRLLLAEPRDSRWWLAHHMNGAMLNFIATHDSFVALGVGSIVPELRQPVPRMLVAATVIGVGITLRATLRRRYGLRERQATSIVESAAIW